MQRTIFGLIVAMLLIASPAFAQWQEPEDGKFTEKQLTDYLAVTKQIIEDAKAAGKAVEESPNAIAAMTIAARTGEKFQAALASKNMSEDEFNWLGNKVWEAYGVALMSKEWDKGLAGIKAQQDANNRELEATKAKLADVQRQRAETRRTITPEERTAAVEKLQADRPAVAEELDAQKESVKQAQSDIDKYEAQFKEAESLAQNPPADVTPENRAQFIDDRKHDAESAESNLNEARQRFAEANKSVAETQARLDAIDQRIKDPTAPASDEDKQQIQQENDSIVADLQSKISHHEQAAKELSATEESFKTMIAESQANVNKDNVELLSRHTQDIADALGIPNPNAEKK